MEFLIEDGSGVDRATSYLSEEDLWEFAPFSAAEPGAGDPKGALIRASAWIDAAFGPKFTGAKVKGRAQGLAWPRSGATDAAGDAVAADAVPVEVRKATAEAALRELAAAGSLAPDVAAGPAVKRERKKLSGMEKEIEYAVADGARPPAPWFPAIAGILAPLIGESDPLAPTWFWR